MIWKPFQSRKFNTALTGVISIIVTILVGKYGLDMDETTIATLAASITVIVGALIGAIAHEDHGAKIGAEWSDTIPRRVDSDVIPPADEYQTTVRSTHDTD